MEKLSTTLDEYRTVFDKLFPSASPESLVQMPREQLLELMGRAGDKHTQAQVAGQHGQHPASPATSASVEAHVSPMSNDDGNLESLQTMPEESSSDSRTTSNSETVPNISDDVNALSLSSKQSSYLGVSSIHAVLKVIVWLDPGCLGYFSRTPAFRGRGGQTGLEYDGETWQGQSQSQPQAQPQGQTNSQPQPQPQPQPQMPVTPPQATQVTDMQMINAYFTYFHPFVPMLDEAGFRETYLSNRRRDDRWLALVNIVFALGSIAASTADDMSHAMYFQRAKSHLGLDSLGCSHLETIQTLGLMGGYYLHYTSQPNLSYSLMGAALRMAATLGLHKEFGEVGVGGKEIDSTEVKRRVWWSLFCMDTWGCMTLGRPSMGRLGPTITVKLPHYREKVPCPVLTHAQLQQLTSNLGKRPRHPPPARKHPLLPHRNSNPRSNGRGTTSPTPGDNPPGRTTPRMVREHAIRTERPRTMQRVDEHDTDDHAMAIQQPADAPVPTYIA